MKTTGDSNGSYDFFMSYKSNDAGIVRLIAEQLMARGLRVWFAEYSIALAGRLEFRQAILSGINESVYGICFTSPGYFASEFCGMELQTLLATRDSSRLIQIRLETLPGDFVNPVPCDVPTVDFAGCQETIAAILKIADVRIRAPRLVLPGQDARREWRLQGRRFSLDTQGWRVRQFPRIDGSGGISFKRRIGLRMVRGTLTVKRESQNDPCLRDGTLDDAVYFERAFGFRRSKLSEGRCDGLHLLRIQGFRQLGFTVYLKHSVARSYMIAYPQPHDEGSLVFTFTFRLPASRRFFLEHAYLLDKLATSLECADLLCACGEADAHASFVLPADTVRHRAENQAGEIGGDVNALATEWMRHHVGKRMGAPGRGVIEFDLKIDMLVKAYPAELASFLILKLPVGVQRPAIDAFTAMSSRWDPGSRERAAEAMSCLLSLMDPAEARHLLCCMSEETRTLVRTAADRLRHDPANRTARSSRDADSATAKGRGSYQRENDHGRLRDAEMVEVPAGTFLMGTSPNDVDGIGRRCGNWQRSAFAREQPQREIWLAAFFIDKYPVTNLQYKVFIDETGHPVPCRNTPFARPYNWDPQTREYPPRLANHPVVLVDWQDACAYAAWAGKRLPTEAEWEKASRGTDGRIWPWGNEWDDRACNHGMGRAKGTSAVMDHLAGASPYGAVDMAGNVWEWCLDGFDSEYHRRTEIQNPQGQGHTKVIRGGCWYDEYPELFRCAVRDGISADAWEFYRGFRCVRG